MSVILIPNLSPDTLSIPTQNHEHSITPQEFASWARNAGKEYQSSGQSQQPKKNTSDPANSSRAHILEYTLHLALHTRVDLWATPIQGSVEDLVRLDTEALGLWRVGRGLWEAGKRSWVDQANKSIPLPAAKSTAVNMSGTQIFRSKGLNHIHLRVLLAELAEGVLGHPVPSSGFRALTLEAPMDASQIPGLRQVVRLSKNYESTANLPNNRLGADGVDTRSNSNNTIKKEAITKSLIELKFGGQEEEEASLPSTSSHPFFGRISGTASPTGSSSAPSGSGLRSGREAAPHMDYRIVRGQAMRDRAKEIYKPGIHRSDSAEQASTASYCARHREMECSVCPLVFQESRKQVGKVQNFPGQGLHTNVEPNTFTKKMRNLLPLIPTFLKLVAGLLLELREDFEDPCEPESNKPSPTHEFFLLLSSFITQAVLDGYLVGGWQGIDGMEICFGLGCGVWEGKGWSVVSDVGRGQALGTSNISTRLPQAPPSPSESSNESLESSESSLVNSDSESESDAESEASSSDSDSDSDTDVQLEELDTEAHLLKAAKLVFGNRNIAQAEYEKVMKDRCNRFLDVPCDSTVSKHLQGLNAEFSLVEFERRMVKFIEAIDQFLGTPKLVQDKLALSSPTSIDNSGPNPFALNSYFAPSDYRDREKRTRANEDDDKAKKMRLE